MRLEIRADDGSVFGEFLISLQCYADMQGGSDGMYRRENLE